MGRVFGMHLLLKNKIPKRSVEIFDTISVCLSKVEHNGSVLLADKATIHRALRIRKYWRWNASGGYLAAAGIYALKQYRTFSRRSKSEGIRGCEF
jgi:threonine aldolase